MVAVRRPRPVPQRTCVQCRTERDKRDLLRVVRAPDGSVAVDASGQLNGRGAYVCRDDACITGATTRGTLGRALATHIPGGLRTELRAAAGLPAEAGTTMHERGGSGGKE